MSGLKERDQAKVSTPGQSHSLTQTHVLLGDADLGTYKPGRPGSPFLAVSQKSPWPVGLTPQALPDSTFHPVPLALPALGAGPAGCRLAAFRSSSPSVSPVTKSLSKVSPGHNPLLHMTQQFTFQTLSHPTKPSEDPELPCAQTIPPLHHSDTTPQSPELRMSVYSAMSLRSLNLSLVPSKGAWYSLCRRGPATVTDNTWSTLSSLSGPTLQSLCPRVCPRVLALPGKVPPPFLLQDQRPK